MTGEETVTSDSAAVRHVGKQTGEFHVLTVRGHSAFLPFEAPHSSRLNVSFSVKLDDDKDVKKTRS